MVGLVKTHTNYPSPTMTSKSWSLLPSPMLRFALPHWLWGSWCNRPRHGATHLVNGLHGIQKGGNSALGHSAVSARHHARRCHGGICSKTYLRPRQSIDAPHHVIGSSRPQLHWRPVEFHVCALSHRLHRWCHIRRERGTNACGLCRSIRRTVERRYLCSADVREEHESRDTNQ